jgi:ABC-2 type transport system permease protein
VIAVANEVGLTRRQPLAQTMALTRRSVLAIARQPAVFLPAMVFPLLIAAVNTATVGIAVNAPFWPPPKPDSYLDFVMAATIVQGVMFGGVFGGSDLALDIENGFFERLLASPVARPAILVGRVGGAAALGIVQVVLFTIAFMLFGARVAGGVPGVIVLVIVAALLAIGVGALAAAVGLRTGSAEAVQNSFPLVFVLVFISSAFFPTELMSGWYQTVAEHNPVSWLVEGMRYQIIVGFDLGEALKAIAVAGALAVGGIAFATYQLNRRLRVAQH